MTAPLSRKLLAETLGTALLLAVVIGSGIMGERLAGGNAAIAYYISGATSGYQVTVSVTVTSGRSRGTCSTSFIPHR